jgi:hypothetical protein
MAIGKGSSLLLVLLVAGIFMTGSAPPLARAAESCTDVVRELNRKLEAPIDGPELVAVLQSLNGSDNRKLPTKFVTKKQAQKLGWQPGRDLWKSLRLKGKSIGGDHFANRERRLPNDGRTWREADLDYKGGHRGAKRLVFSTDGLRRVTVDHYRTFTEIPACQ